MIFLINSNRGFAFFIQLLCNKGKQFMVCIFLFLVNAAYAQDIYTRSYSIHSSSGVRQVAEKLIIEKDSSFKMIVYDLGLIDKEPVDSTVYLGTWKKERNFMTLEEFRNTYIHTFCLVNKDGALFYAECKKKYRIKGKPLRINVNRN